jgi:hypothetical protein
MYQFRREDMALEAARVLAVYETQPIAVMARGLMDFFTIGPIDNAAVHEAGRHMATVYRSGHVEHMGLASSPSFSYRWGQRETAEHTGYKTGAVLAR